ncbi:MAG: DUF4105 domain-containing protein [Treponema sp.]|jgi:hypothetical protein|nr:DUF4105 domain-containing protein [Treponema sp.]
MLQFLKAARIAAAACLLFAGSLYTRQALFAQDVPDTPAHTGAQLHETPQTGGSADRFAIKIAVIGPGDELYFWWGHLALIIEDHIAGSRTFYDWGVFSFNADDFFKNFAFGRLAYMCAASPADRGINRYIQTNRDITVYTLNLSRETKEAVRLFAETNIRPENREYMYHHFKDNCATRIRDIIDMATDGQFKAAFGDAPGRYTLRQHIRRHTWFSPFFDWLLNALMGQDIDAPLTIWQEMFLPAEIGSRIAGFTYIDGNGEAQKLVASVETLNKAVNRPPVLDKPRRQWVRELVAGMIIALLFVLFDRLQKTKPRLGRCVWGLSQSALGLFFGAVGSILFFMTFFTNHDYTYHNANILYINPLWFIAAAAGITYACTNVERKRYIARQVLSAFWTYVFLGGVLTMVIKLFPAFYQQNQVTQALVLPCAFTLSFAGNRIKRTLGRIRRRAG